MLAFFVNNFVLTICFFFFLRIDAAVVERFDCKQVDVRAKFNLKLTLKAQLGVYLIREDILTSQ